MIPNFETVSRPDFTAPAFSADASLSSSPRLFEGESIFTDTPMLNPGVSTSFESLKQIDAGLLNVGYAEVGPPSGSVIILLHGWPYDIHRETPHDFAQAVLAAARF